MTWRLGAGMSFASVIYAIVACTSTQCNSDPEAELFLFGFLYCLGTSVSVVVVVVVVAFGCFLLFFMVLYCCCCSY